MKQMQGSLFSDHRAGAGAELALGSPSTSTAQDGGRQRDTLISKGRGPVSVSSSPTRSASNAQKEAGASQLAEAAALETQWACLRPGVSIL